MRDALVRTRTRYVALVKTLVRRDGLRVTSSESHLVAQRIGALSPSPALEAELQPLFTVLAPLNEQIAAADRRVATLLDSPGDYGVLAKLVAREIIYRLCLGEQGGRLRQIAVSGGRVHRIAKAIELLRTNHKKPLRIAGLARKLGMSVSGLHHHFKAATGMSPLQFQKQFRLQEARWLLLAGEVDAATAGYRVGYDDASHFSREYRRLVGEPPLRDAERLRGSVASRREPAAV